MNAILTTPQFDQWFRRLRDPQGKARVNARLRRISLGHEGDIKALGSGVSELRIHSGPGYRIYLTRRGQEVIILLAGGDKSSQEKDIQLAKSLAEQV